MEISPDIAEWTTSGSVDAGDGELQSWSAVMAVGVTTLKACGNCPLGLRGNCSSQETGFRPTVFTGVTFFRQNDD